MLNSLVAMRYDAMWKVFLYLIVLLGLTASRYYQQEEPQIAIDSPQANQAVQGLVRVTGRIKVENFLAYQLAFSFQEDATETWFSIRQSDEAVAEGVLGEWDTTTLTDGAYTLRLIVQFAVGEPEAVLVEGIRVRNYTPIETETPTVEATPDPLLSTPTPTVPPPTREVRSTPTQLPPNPAEIGPGQVQKAVTFGAVLALVSLAFLFVYAAVRLRGS